MRISSSSGGIKKVAGSPSKKDTNATGTYQQCVTGVQIGTGLAVLMKGVIYTIVTFYSLLFPILILAIIVQH